MAGQVNGKAPSDRRASEEEFLTLKLDEYLSLLDWTGRRIRADKRGAIPNDLTPILDRLKIQPDGWLHVLSEDYGMLHMPAGPLDPDRLWHDGVFSFARTTGTDARIGRHTWALLRQLGLIELRVDYVVVDTLRVPRETLATIFEAWRDGYVDVLGAKSRLRAEEARALFDQIIESVLDPDRYAVWHVPIISGKKA